MNTGLEAIYTDAVSRNGQRVVEVKDELFRGLSAEEKLFIEYRIINKIRYGATKSISCNFIAGAFEDSTVELMVTSATFDANDLESQNNLHSVTLTKISANEFFSNFIDKLATV